MQKKENAPYTGFIKAVSFTLKQFRLYSSNHPITKQAVQTLTAEIEKYFADKDKIRLGSMRKMLVVDGEIVGDKDPAANDLAKDFDRLAIEGVAFEKGLDLTEMSLFISLMAMRSKDLDAKGGFKKAFDTTEFSHIKLSTGKYELVEDDETLAKKDEVGGGGPGPAQPQGQGGGGSGVSGAPVTSVADIIHKIREGKEEIVPAGSQAANASPGTPISLDCEKIMVQLEKNPQEIAEEALSGTQDAAMLESTLRKVVNFLIEGLISFLVEQGKDISKALQKLAKELEKAVEKSLDDDARDKIKGKIPKIFEEAGDEMRIQMMTRTAKEHGKDLKMLKKMATKLFKDEDVRTRLLPSVKEELGKEGLSAEEVESFFAAIKEKAAKRKNKVSIDAKELEELRRKAAMIDSGTVVSGDLDQKVQKLEKEKKVILDEKERVDSVIRNLAEGLLVVDKNGKVVLMNPAAEKMLGVKKEEKMGHAVAEGLSEEHIVSMTKGDLSEQEEQASKNVEVFSLNDDAKKVVQASTAVIENENGKTVGMVSVLSDVTKQKEVEELKTKFVSHVSHELRTPLVAIQKSLGLILENEVGDVNDEQRQFLGIAHRNIERLSRLINDLLDVSKMEARGMELNLKKIKLQDLATSVSGTLETWAKDKKVNLEVKLAEPEVEIQVDPDRLTQVLTNLMGNAVKFTPEDGTVSIESKKVTNDPEMGGDAIEIGVRDTGIGIAPEDQEKIFQKFVQVSLMKPQGVSSTGLGLTIAKEIVELHGGKIWVESKEGVGSYFAFRIPVKSKGASS